MSTKSKIPSYNLVTVLPDDKIKFHLPSDFKQRSIANAGFVASWFEASFYIQCMYMSSGHVSWVVVYSPIDSPIEVKQGMFKIKGSMDRLEKSVGTKSLDATLSSIEEAQRRRLEKELNKAMNELTRDWLDEYWES